LCFIVHGTVNLCWGFFKWGLLVALIAAIAAVPYFYDRLDSEIRQRLLAMLSEQYEGLEISVRSAQFVEDEGIEIRDLVIVETDAAGPRAELLSLPEVFLHSRGTLQEVLSGAIQVREVVIRHPVLRMTRRHDATWSCSRLLPFPKLGEGKGPLPEVRVENATVEVFDPTKNPSSMLVLRNVNLTFSEPGDTLPENEHSPLREISGTLDGDYVSRVELRGQVDLQTGAWSLGGLVEDLEITRESLYSIPEDWLAGCEIPEACRAQASFQFALSGGGEKNAQPCQFTAKGMVNEGRIEDPRLPGPLTELRTSFTVDNQGIVLNDLEAHSGQTTLRLHTLRSWGHGASARKTIEGEVERLELDRNLLAALPDRFTETWSKYLPTGQINAEFTADFDGARWRPRTATVECLNVSFSYHKFPYRLHRARGTVQEGDDLVALKLENDALRISMVAFSGKNPVTVTGVISHPLSGPYGDVTIQAAQLALNDDLFAAMKAEPQKVVRALNPKGMVSVDLRIWSNQHGIPPNKKMTCKVLGGSICYEKFPYPLNVDPGGLITMDNDRWQFTNFTGSNDTGTVTCEGWFAPTAEGKRLEVGFTGANLDLEEELRDSFRQPTTRQLWNDLRLRGKIDLQELRISYLVETNDLDVTFRATPKGEVTSIEPVHLPYRLEKLRGVVVYEEGRITIEDFEGNHGDARIAAKVTCRFTPDGSWNLRLDDMLVEQLQLDNDLTRALPERFRSAVTELDTRTPINLAGSVEVARNSYQIDRLMSAWNLDVVFHRAHLNCGVPIDNVSGKVALWGQSNGETLLCRGELDRCSLMYRDIQITQVSGPILIDDQRVLLGTQVPPSANQRPRSIQGSVFGGSVYGSGVSWLGKNAGYHLSGRLFEADLARAAQELVSGRQSLTGKVFAQVDLKGDSKTINAMEGHGTVRLRDTDIYELPAMVSLLKILTIRPPDNTAFSESDIDFHIRGNHVYLPKIAFRGDAISLEGDGEMDANRNVNLEFRTRLGRGDLGLSFLREALGGAGDQLVLIHVEGPVSNPRIIRQPLPAVNKLIEKLQVPVESPGPLPQTGAANSYGRAAPQWR
jgi:AsmA-like protein